MNIFLEEHQEILKALNKNGVDFLLVGGFAVNYHGYNRTTGDMDLWIKPDNENKMIGQKIQPVLSNGNPPLIAAVIPPIVRMITPGIVNNLSDAIIPETACCI